MPRLTAPLLSALLLVGGALSCSSDSETAGSTAERTTTRVSTRDVSTAERPPPSPAAKPPTSGTRKRIYAELARARDSGLSADAAYRQVARREGIGVESVVLIEHEGSLRRWPLPPAPKLPPRAVRVRPSAKGARGLRSSVRCSANAPRTGIADLRWRPSRQPATTQWVAVTIFLRGFALGSFEASGPLRPQVSSFKWHRVHGRAIHQWRVITRDRRGRWLGSAIARFTGPTCVAEFQP